MKTICKAQKTKKVTMRQCKILMFVVHTQCLESFYLTIFSQSIGTFKK